MSTFSVTRSANGQVVLGFQNLDNYNVDGVGKMSGDAKFSLGTTGASNETVLQIGQSSDAGSLVFEATSSKDNIEFYGTNIDASIKNQSTSPYNISWKAHNSKFDSSKSASSVLFSADKESYNNYIQLGASKAKVANTYDNLIYDDGKDNIYVSADNTTSRVETLANSKGAFVDAGNGANEFYVGGDLGTFVGGTGQDTFITSKATAYKNMMIGKEGADVLADYGNNSLFIGGSGYDTTYMYGTNGIANHGFNETGKYDWTYGTGNSVFTGESQTDVNGKVYSYKDVLKQKGWTLASYLTESGIANNPYYSLIKKDVEESLG